MQRQPPAVLEPPQEAFGLKDVLNMLKSFCPTQMGQDNFSKLELMFDTSTQLMCSILAEGRVSSFLFTKLSKSWPALAPASLDVLAVINP